MSVFANQFDSAFSAESFGSIKTLPDLTVEIAFGQNLNTAPGSLTWTDVTDQVRIVNGLNLSRGRGEVGQTTAGSLSVTFDNTDGDFTTGRDDGAYGEITVRVPIRVKATTGETTHTLWTGFVTDWGWDMASGEVRATCDAADIIAAAAKTYCLGWIQGRTVNASPSTLSNYWPLGDDAGASYPASGCDGPAGLVSYNGLGGDLTMGVATGLAGGETTVASFTPADSTNYHYIQGAGKCGGDMAVGVFMRPVATLAFQMAVGVTSGNGPLLAVGINSDGRVVVLDDGYQWHFGAANTVPLQQWRHVYVQRQQWSGTAGAYRILVWVDGVQQSLHYIGAGFWGTWTGGYTSVPVDVTIGSVYVWPWDGQLAHVSLWSHINHTSEFMAKIRDQGMGGTAATRWTTLAETTYSATEMKAWMSADYDADVRMASQATKDRTLLDICQDVANTEAGRIIATKDGKLHLHSSTHTGNAAASLTVSAESDVLSFDGAFSLDDAQEVGSSIVTNHPSGNEFTYTRSSAPGLETRSVDIYAERDVQAEVIAQWLTDAARTGTRAPQLVLSVDKANENDTVDGILNLDLGDRVTVTDLPAAAPATSMDFVVESISHDISANGWTVTLDTSPWSSIFQVGDSTYGAVGSGAPITI